MPQPNKICRIVASCATCFGFGAITLPTFGVQVGTFAP